MPPFCVMWPNLTNSEWDFRVSCTAHMWISWVFLTFGCHVQILRLILYCARLSLPLLIWLLQATVCAVPCFASAVTALRAACRHWKVCMRPVKPAGMLHASHAEMKSFASLLFIPVLGAHLLLRVLASQRITCVIRPTSYVCIRKSQNTSARDA